MTTPPITVAGWTRLQIAQKFRALTGTPSTDQLSDDSVYAYLNNYLVFVMPMELKVQIQNIFLDFKTEPGQDVYSFPAGFFTNSPGAYADGFPLIFYESPDIFYQDWPQQYAVDQVATGDDTTTTFAGNTLGFPIIIESFFITDNTQVLQSTNVLDNPSVPDVYTLIGDGTGTLNVVTGAFSATFTNAPSSQVVVYDKYIAYRANRPQGVLWFENEFTFMPVPDQVYQIRMQGFLKPDLLDEDDSVPAQQEWGPLIAYGGALEFFSDRGDTGNYDRYYPMLKRYENVALSRTIEQYQPMQGVPRF